MVSISIHVHSYNVHVCTRHTHTHVLDSWYKSNTVRFKIACISFKAIHFHTPQYLHDLLHWYTPVRTLRSANKNLLSVPSSRTILADRAFSRAAPTVWNALPSSVTSVNTFPSFKKAQSKPIYFSWPTTHNPEVSASESDLSLQNYGAI